MAGDVAHRYGKRAIRIFAPPQKIKIITADFIAGYVSAGDIQAMNVRFALGQQAFLHLSGQRQSLFMLGHIGYKRHVADDLSLIVPEGVAVN